MEQDEKLERFMLGMLPCVNDDEEYKKYRLKGFEKFYLYTNEHLPIFLKRIGMEDKRVLTVGSSGDQILYSLGLGAKEVVCFDLCPFAKEYFALKTACIKSLTFEEYKEIVGDEKQILSSAVYAKVSHNLDEEARVFWDELFLNGFNENDFCAVRANVRLMGNETYMSNEQTYNKIKIALKNSPKVKFIESDLREIAEKLPSDDIYDVILLSNIYQYSKYWYKDNPRRGQAEFIQVVQDLSTHLSAGGTMQIDYAYKDRLKKYTYMQERLPNGKVSSSAISFKVGPILYRNTTNSEQEESM